MQLARAVGELGDAAMFDEVIGQASAAASAGSGLGGPAALYEAQLRGLMETGRAGQAWRLLSRSGTLPVGMPPQWQTMIAITIAEVHMKSGDTGGAHAALLPAIAYAETHRLPHQLQRAQRCAGLALPDVHEQCLAAFTRITPNHALRRT